MDLKRGKREMNSPEDGKNRTLKKEDLDAIVEIEKGSGREPEELLAEKIGIDEP